MAVNVFYLRYFGLQQRPFTLLPDPDFLYWSEQHRRGYAVLEYGIMSRAPITILTGEIGAGKTTLLQKLLAQLEAGVTIGLISNAQGNRGEILQWVLNSLGVDYDTGASYVQNFQKLQDFLVEACFRHDGGRHFRSSGGDLSGWIVGGHDILVLRVLQSMLNLIIGIVNTNS